MGLAFAIYYIYLGARLRPSFFSTLVLRVVQLDIFLETVFVLG